MRGANRIQQPDERDAIFLTQSLQRLLVRARRRARRSSPAARALSRVIQHRCCRRSFGQRWRRTSSLASSRSSSRVTPGVCSIIRSADLERRQPLVAGAAQDAQHVELLQRDAVRLDERRRRAGGRGPRSASGRRRLRARPTGTAGAGEARAAGRTAWKIDYTSIVDMSSIGRMSAMNHQIRLKSRPTGEPTADNFEAVDAPVPEPTGRRGPAPHDLSLARSLHARPHERRRVLRARRSRSAR